VSFRVPDTKSHAASGVLFPVQRTLCGVNEVILEKGRLDIRLSELQVCQRGEGRRDEKE